MSELPFDLWIIPPTPRSRWFARLDWYLNWQMCKGLAHRSTPPPPDLFRLAEEYGFKVESRTTAVGAPLIISAKGHLPTKACLVLPFEDNAKDWLASAKNIASQILAMRARVFLPAGLESEKCQNIWNKVPGTCEAEFMEDDQELL